MENLDKIEQISKSNQLFSFLIKYLESWTSFDIKNVGEAYLGEIIRVLNFETASLAVHQSIGSKFSILAGADPLVAEKLKDVDVPEGVGFTS